MKKNDIPKHHTKLSVSLPSGLVGFIGQYQQQHHTSRSEVIKYALELLQERELGQSYGEANCEIDPDDEHAVQDGLKATMIPLPE